MTIKYKPLPQDILLQMPKVKEYLLAHPRVVFAYLFGGISRAVVRPLSDIDIAVYLSEGSDLKEERYEILGRLAGLLRTDEIDLVILNTASLPLKARVIRQKEVVVDKDPSLRHQFESLVLREYFDFSIKERDILFRRFSLGR
ncbi:MAG: nucleotidyltransferase domain-containing protein [Candidatus Brocadiales bacterium]|nr:nucleotidyltransferase domain-containing protein [Candidatus Brocadiales bacterium]